MNKKLDEQEFISIEKSYMENNDSDENNFNKIKVNIKKLDMIWVLGRKLIKELNWPSGKKKSLLSADFFCSSVFFSMCSGYISECVCADT